MKPMNVEPALKKIFNKYTRLNLNTKKRVILDVSMSGTNHSLLNIVSMDKMTHRNDKILLIAPKVLMENLDRDVKEATGNQASIVRDKKDEDAIINPKSKFTIIGMERLSKFYSSGKAVSVKFDHFIIKNRLPKFPSKGYDLISSIFSQAKKVIIDEPIYNQESFIILTSLSEGVSMSDGSSIFFVNDTLSSASMSNYFTKSSKKNSTQDLFQIRKT